MHITIMNKTSGFRRITRDCGMGRNGRNDVGQCGGRREVSY